MRVSEGYNFPSTRFEKEIVRILAVIGFIVVGYCQYQEVEGADRNSSGDPECRKCGYTASDETWLKRTKGKSYCPKCRTVQNPW